jgi:hypothetical protein
MVEQSRPFVKGASSSAVSRGAFCSRGALYSCGAFFSRGTRPMR